MLTFDPERSPQIQKTLNRNPSHLSGADLNAILALDTPQRPLSDVGVYGKNGDGMPALWSVHGLTLLQTLRRSNANHARALIKFHTRLTGFTPEREILPDLREGGLAWLTRAISPEDDWINPRTFPTFPFRVCGIWRLMPPLLW